MSTERDFRPTSSTELPSYTNRLIRKQHVRWKEIIDVQAPYRWNLQNLNPGFTLDLGCGIGRNLKHLRGQGVGIDHNPESVRVAQNRGLIAFTPEEFIASSFCHPEQFDTILLAHVAEHMKTRETIELLANYLPYLAPDGKLVMITPQEAGFKSDDTHVEFVDFDKLRHIGEQLNLSIVKEYSFPFPRFAGHLFVYNEFVAIFLKPNNTKPGHHGNAS